MEQRDVERILRDVLNSAGVRSSSLRAERIGPAWRVTITDGSNQLVSTDFSDGPPAAIRAAILRWVDAQI
jgi:hypothetical protein